MLAKAVSLITNDDNLAQRLSLIRNHAEAVVGPMGVEDLQNMIGFNMRMTEIEAAIPMCQLEKLDGLMAERQQRVEYFEKRMQGFEALSMPRFVTAPRIPTMSMPVFGIWAKSSTGMRSSMPCVPSALL